MFSRKLHDFPRSPCVPRSIHCPSRRWLSPKNRSCPGRALPPSRRGSEPFWDCRSRNPSNPGTVGTELSHTT
ncbi:unnamed protein product [Nesidiocoris tenuis]|uniref:Uncharacterized protein n=1 Tax=Nesidiocoris tenuis TaxID=355587 RepID=A0A6H5HEM7_9HEMI|nr:unnamed protein product [Nesidiocoris tenuis]